MSRLVAFGEIMLRLSPPGRELLLQTPTVNVWVGGAEANVATALAHLGHDVRMISAVPSGRLGDAAVAQLRGSGVDVRGIVRCEGRMGLYFVTTGAGLRPTDVIYDRAGSAFSVAPADSWDWGPLLDGADRLHLSGITPALGANGTALALFAAAEADAAGVPISFDGNYRSRLWDSWDGRPGETLFALVERADILFGDHRDIGLLLDEDFSGRHQDAVHAAFARFPKLRLIASTARDVAHSDSHRLSAHVDTRDQSIATDPLEIAGIVDRIGSGDAFAAGVLHGLMRNLPLDKVAETGLALTALKHSLPGDASLFTEGDLAAFRASGLDVRR